MYKKLDENLIKELSGIIGPDNLLMQESDLVKYSIDESDLAGIFPEAVVLAQTPEDIIEIVKFASRHKIPITPRGGGTGLTGGAMSICGGVVLSLEKMNKILDIDEKNKMAIVQPGVINSVLQEESEKLGLFYPVNPASMESCTLGGNVANATGGANTVRYGTTRNYLTGLTSVNPMGELWSAGGSIVKNSSDQVLMQLMCGSEGILSIFSEITFRLIDKPSKNIWIIAGFKDVSEIPEVSAKIFRAKLEPTMVELMDKATIEICRQYLKTDIPMADMHQLLIRFDSNDENLLSQLSERAGTICMENGSYDVLIASTRIEQEKIWKMRSSMHEAIVTQQRSVCEEDAVVPVSKINDFISEILKISEKYKVKPVVFGHLGDGNLHVNLLYSNADQTIFSEEYVEKIKFDIFNTAIAMGGKPSGEHGIGLTKKNYYKKLIDPVYLKMLKDLKAKFDPHNIMNPGKIFDI